MQAIIGYLKGVAEFHHIDPLLFVLIYLVSTVPFLLISGWLVHHIRNRKPLALLIFLWGLCYCAPYIYMLSAGRKLSVWVYLAVAAMVIGGLALAGRGLRQRLAREKAKDVSPRAKHTGRTPRRR